MIRFTRLLALTFSTLLLFQSCRVYHKKTVTVEEAVQSNKRVMVRDINERTFKFKELMKEDEQLYGLAKKRSSTAKRLTEAVVDNNSDGKYVKIRISDKSIREYHLQNKTMSILLSVFIPAALFLTLGGITAQEALTWK